MDKSSIEQKIKDRLINHEESIDNEYLFEKLGIEEKPSKKRFFILFFLLIGFGILGTVGYYLTTDSNNPPLAINNQSHLQNDQVFENSSNEDHQNSEPSNTKESIQNTESSDTFTNEVTNSFTSKSVKNSLEISTEKSLRNTSSIHIESTKPSTSSHTKNLNSSNALSIEEHTAFSNEQTIVNTFPNQATSQQNFIQEENDLTSDEIDEKSRTVLKERYIKTAFFNPFIVKEQTLIANGVSLPSHPLIDTIPSISKKTKWTLMPYASYDVFRQSHFATDSPLSEYSSLRKASEFELEAIGGGIMINYRIDDHWHLGAGIEYNQYNSQFNYSELIPTNRKDTSLVVSVSYLGDSTITNGAVVETFKERKWNTFNELRMINVPVLVGYSHDFKKVSTFIELGVQVGFYSDFKGRLHSESFRILEDPNFYKNLNLSSEIGLGLSYNLSKKSGLYWKIRYRTFLTEISSGENPLDEHIWQVGSVIGYQYRFQK